MIEFQIQKTSRHSRARIGTIKTPHGEIETPCLVPVATQAVVKTLTSEEAKAAKCQLLIANTFHLHLKPGEGIVKRAGGLHDFMNWDRPLMTDSAGYQVFSLGFGKDLGVGKIGKGKTVKLGTQPRSLKITNEGVTFQSPVDGRRLFIGPAESIRIQEALGADIILAFDECTPPSADYSYTKRSLTRTHRWAETCLHARRSRQALFGIVQGGRFRELRVASAKFIGRLPFDGFGIGGEFGASKTTMVRMLRWVIKELPPEKPRHLLGIGHLEDIPKIIAEGVDTFDCTLPTHYARHGVAFTSSGRLDLNKSAFLKDQQKLDPRCNCEVCTNYSRAYITHLLRAKEITPLRLLTFHNLFFFNSFVEKIRRGIKRGKL